MGIATWTKFFWLTQSLPMLTWILWWFSSRISVSSLKISPHRQRRQLRSEVFLFCFVSLSIISDKMSEQGRSISSFYVEWSSSLPKEAIESGRGSLRPRGVLRRSLNYSWMLPTIPFSPHAASPKILEVQWGPIRWRHVKHLFPRLWD